MVGSMGTERKVSPRDGDGSRDALIVPDGDEGRPFILYTRYRWDRLSGKYFTRPLKRHY